MRSGNRDHISLLCDVGELAAKLVGSANIRGFLDQIVDMVASHLDSDVCSIYLYDEDTDELILQATHGLNRDSIGQLRLRPTEGLTGLAFRELRAVREDHASTNPNFKPIAGINEEPYESFLAAPISRGIERVGVLVVQRDRSKHFTEQDLKALRATASQLASALENARILIELQEPRGRTVIEEPAPAGGLIRGVVGCSGFAYGKATVLDPGRDRRLLKQRASEQSYTLEEFRDALAETVHQLRDLQKRLGQRLPEMASLIFDAHLMMLKDSHFLGEIEESIHGGANPPEALRRVAQKYIDVFQESSHAYIREKSQDVEDLVKRVLANLTGAGSDIPGLGEAQIIVCRDLLPSDMLKLASSGVKGIVLVSGGVTSHISILTRSLKIPMIIAEDARLMALPKSTHLLLNTEVGNIYINPTPEAVEQFRARDRARRQVDRARHRVLAQTHTADDCRVQLLANINLLGELPIAADVKAEGIGLYRSEFPFLVRSTLPSEEEQLVIYSQLVRESPSPLVTFRTLDLGGDKLLAYYDSSGEENPQMGLRSIRFSFRHRDVFEQQLRAILRAAEGIDLRIMFPMISSVEDFLKARDITRRCIEDLREEGVNCHRSPEIGMMVEVPSAVALIDVLAEEADFLCIGTNDLTQFLLAVDRTNEKVAEYYTSCHPAVLRALKRVTEVCIEAGKHVSVCGEMAHERDFLPFLLGIGIRSLSVDPQFLPEIQQSIAKLSVEQCRLHAEEVLAERTVMGIARRMHLHHPQSSSDQVTAE